LVVDLVEKWVASMVEMLAAIMAESKVSNLVDLKVG
jgi:hypothetical protein